MGLGDWFRNFWGGVVHMGLSIVEKLGRAAVWMLTVVVIPMTIWFITLRSDVDSLKKKELQTTEEIRVLSGQVNEFRGSTEKGIQEIARSLGRVEGELRRIK